MAISAQEMKIVQCASQRSSGVTFMQTKIKVLISVWFSPMRKSRIKRGKEIHTPIGT